MKEIRSLILRITERCNLHCAYCYAADSGCIVQDMSAQLAIEAVSRCCPEGGNLHIQFTGGEPLLNISVMEQVYAFGKATGRKLRLAVQTNGTLLTPAYCHRLKAMQCAVGVSLDGLKEANSLRTFSDGSDAFPQVLQGIRYLADASIRCNLTTVVTKANAASLGQLPDLALWLGNVNGVGLDLFRPLGRGKGEELMPLREDLSHGLTELIHKTKELQQAGIPFRLREIERQKKRIQCNCCDLPYCYAQTEQSMCIDPAGNCWPCSSLAGVGRFFLGNIRDGLPEHNFSRSALELPKKCRNCDILSACGGGCPAGRIAHCQEPDSLTCLINRILLEENGI